MAMSGSWRTTYQWKSQYNKYLWHVFEWSATRSGYTTTVSYKVKCDGTDTQSVNQHCYLKVTANGSTKVDKKSERTNWHNWASGEGEVGDCLLSGSFTVDHSYSDGSASFTVQLKSAIYYGSYQCDESTTISLTAISVGNPSISSITDNGNNTITIDYDYGSNLTGGTGYLYIKKGSDVSNSDNGYSKSITKSSDTTTKITVSLDSISSITKSSIKNKQTIAARFYQYNSSILKYSGAKTKEVYYYTAPGAPTGIGYSTNNKYGKYTPTSKITFSWKKPSSGCDGYRIRIWKNGSQIKHNGDSYIYDRSGGDNVTYTIDCTSLGIKAGDKVQIGLYAYVTNGAGTKLWSGSGMNETFSSQILIVPDKNFVAHAKINGSWKKVELMHAKIGSTFYEVGNLYAADGRYS